MSSSGTSFSPVPLPDLDSAAPGTAVILDASAAQTATTRAPGRGFVATAPVDPVTPVDDEPSTTGPAGYVVYELDGMPYAVAVEEVHEIVRRARLRPVPGARTAEGGIALVDVRGRAIPVLDARPDRDRAGRAVVLLPVFRHRIGLVVDRVLAVRADLEVEQDEPSPVLPSRALGVLRPAEGGEPILRVELPSASGPAARTGRPTP